MEQSRSTIFIDTLMNYPPLPDLSVFDFDYRPTIECIEEQEDPHDGSPDKAFAVAGISLNHTVHGDYIPIYMKVKGKKVAYYFSGDESTPDDEYMASKMSVYEHQLSFGQFVRYLEKYELSDWINEASVGWYMYDAFEASVGRPVTQIKAVEIDSGVYPQLEQFYDTMTRYIVDWMNDLTEFPSLDEFLKCIEFFLDGVPRTP